MLPLAHGAMQLLITYMYMTSPFKSTCVKTRVQCHCNNQVDATSWSRTLGLQPAWSETKKFSSCVPVSSPALRCKLLRCQPLTQQIMIFKVSNNININVPSSNEFVWMHACQDSREPEGEFLQYVYGICCVSTHRLNADKSLAFGLCGRSRLNGAGQAHLPVVGKWHT